MSHYFLWLFDLLGLHPSPGLLPCQILPEEAPTQEQEPNSPLNDPVGVEGDPVDSPAQHATDGKEVKRPFYSSTIIMN